MARVAVVFTGGTISTAFDPAAGGNVPVLDGAAILARTPGLDAIADVVPIDRGRTPASHFTFPVLLDIAGDPADGPGRPVDRRRRRRPGHGHDRGDGVLLGPRPGRPEAGRRDRGDAGVGRGRLRRTGQPARRGRGWPPRSRCAAPGVVVSLGGTIEPADDVTKMHASALDTFASPNGGSLGRVDGSGVSRSSGGGPAGGTWRRPVPRSGSTSSPRPWRWTARCWTRPSRAGADGIVVAATGAGNTDRGPAGGGRPRDGRRDPGRTGHPLSGRPGRDRLRVPGRRRTLGRGGGHPGRPAVRGQGAGRAGARASARAWTATDWRLCSPTRQDRLTDAPRDPHHRPDRDARRRRPGSAGSRRSGSATGGSPSPARRSTSRRARTRSRSGSSLEPDEVAIPGLTDAHLHLAGAASSRQRDRPDRRARRSRRGSPVSAPPTGRHRDPDAWLGRSRLGARTAGAAGRPPTTSRPCAPGRRVALWAHDHHALLVSRTRRCGPPGSTATRRTPPAASSGRDADGGAGRRPATRRPRALVSDPHPADGAGGPRARRSWRSAHELLALGVVAVHDPGPRLARSGARAGRSRPTPACRRPAACRSGSTPRSGTTPSRRRSRAGCAAATILGADPDGRARIGWQKCFADGSLGSRTAALLADIEPEPDRPLPPELRRGVWMTEPEALRELVDARRGRRDRDRRSTRSATPRCRAALDALEPTARSACRSCPRIEHVQLLDPADRPRFAAAGSRPASSPSTSGATRPRPDGCGATEPSGTATPGARSRRPGPSSRSGPTRRSSRSTRGPGSRWPSAARTRAGRPARPPFGPDEALSLERALRAACVDPAVSAARTRSRPADRRPASRRRDHPRRRPRRARSSPAARWRPRGPSIVLIDGRVVFER